MMSRPTKIQVGGLQCEPRSTAGLQLALGGLPNNMRVEVDPDIGVSAKTVGELRKATSWPENLAIMTPHDSESAVKVGRAKRAGARYSEALKPLPNTGRVPLVAAVDHERPAGLLMLELTDLRRSASVGGFSYPNHEVIIWQPAIAKVARLMRGS
jgi:hypothetical protein